MVNRRIFLNLVGGCAISATSGCLFLEEQTHMEIGLINNTESARVFTVKVKNPSEILIEQTANVLPSNSNSDYENISTTKINDVLSVGEEYRIIVEIDTGQSMNKTRRVDCKKNNGGEQWGIRLSSDNSLLFHTRDC